MQQLLAFGLKNLGTINALLNTYGTIKQTFGVNGNSLMNFFNPRRNQPYPFNPYNPYQQANYYHPYPQYPHNQHYYNPYNYNRPYSTNFNPYQSYYNQRNSNMSLNNLIKSFFR